MGTAAMGAAALSFVQVAADRAGNGLGLRERSRCPGCAARLRTRDVLPVVGFVLLRGRCHGCKAKIPRRHLAGELAAAGYWGTAVVALGASVWLLAVLVLPLWALLPRAALGSARGAAAALLPPLGVALLAFGLAGLRDGRWVAYATGGLLGGLALLTGAVAARGDIAVGGSATSTHSLGRVARNS